MIQALHHLHCHDSTISIYMYMQDCFQEHPKDVRLVANGLMENKKIVMHAGKVHTATDRIINAGFELSWSTIQLMKLDCNIVF